MSKQEIEINKILEELNHLKDENKKLKTAQKLSHVGNWEFDLVNNELYWSDEVYRIFRLDEKIHSPSYESFLNLIHPDDVEMVNNAYQSSLKSQKKYEVTHRLRFEDGSIKYVKESCDNYYDKDGKAIKSLGTIQDITKEKETKLKLEKTLSYFKSHKIAMNESSIVTRADLRGNITYVNDNFCFISGYTKDEVIGRPHNFLRHPDTPKEIFVEMWKTIRSKKVWHGKIQNRGKKEDYWVDITIVPILDESNNIVEYIGVRHNITSIIKHQDNLAELAKIDTLTGLGNRYKLLEDIKTSTTPALALINIDNFSQLNNLYGDDIGDEILKEFANSILNNKNDMCSAYHLHGDEYVIFNKNMSERRFVQYIYDLERKIRNKSIYMDNKQIIFNFTMAISFEDPQEILKTANMAMKRAKLEKKEFLIYEETHSFAKEYRNNMKWMKKIHEAIQNDKIVPVFQAIVNNQTNKNEKYESLVRLDDGGELISPYFFLDIAKKTKHYTSITKIMIEKTFEKFKNTNVEFSINLTVDDILNFEIKDFIINILEKYKIGSRVVFEIVESESIENFEEVIDFIDAVKQYNVKIAIDDFGTGYSNFIYLMRLKADYIKIDGSMIKDIDKDENAQIVVSAIVDFAKKMNIKTIAEFVENQSIHNKIMELGIDYSQGYYFGKPQKNLTN